MFLFLINILIIDVVQKMYTYVAVAQPEIYLGGPIFYYKKCKHTQSFNNKCTFNLCCHINNKI